MPRYLKTKDLKWRSSLTKLRTLAKGRSMSAVNSAEAYQVYVLRWPRPQAGGVLGLFYPWLVSSELMHYGYAIVMLIGIWTLRAGFQEPHVKWWTIALVIQVERYDAFFLFNLAKV
jgi:hypothetical protein